MSILAGDTDRTRSTRPPKAVRLEGAVGALWRRVVDRLEARSAWLVLGAAMVVYSALALWVMRGTTLFVDEQNIFISDNGFHPSALLRPFNGHLFLFERVVYATDFRVFGPNFLVPRVVEVVGVNLVVVLVFVLVRRRIGPAAALAPAILVLFFGSAWENAIVPSGIATVYATAAGLGALLALDGRRRPSASTRSPTKIAPRDIAACALLIVSIFSWTLGVAFALGALVLILLQPGSWRRAWVALLPLALYAAWLVWVRAVYVPAHGEVQGLQASNILLVPNFIANEAASVVGALAGLNYPFQPKGYFAPFTADSEYGPVLATLGVAALIIRLRRGGGSPWLWALLVTLLAFWVALALGSGIGRDPTTARYVYGGGILVLLVAAEAARGVRLSPAALAALYLIALLALGANVARLRMGVHFYRDFASSLRANLTAVELARGHVSPGFTLQPQPSLQYIAAGPYLTSAARIGSPAYSVAELVRQPEGVRHGTDLELVAAMGIAISPHAKSEQFGGCRRFVGVGRSLLTFPVGPAGVMLYSRTARQVSLRRFASRSTVPVGSLPANRPVDLRIPTDRSMQPWHLSVTPSPSSLTVCPLRAPS
jgi:hypothetical protein